MEWFKDDYYITDDRDKVDYDRVHDLLSRTYWARHRSKGQTILAINNSLCFSLFLGDQQIGFARLVTDRATFSWLCDVIINEAYRGYGLGKWLMSCVTGHPDVKKTQQILKTRDAHSLYEQFGFENSACMRKSSEEWLKRAREG